MAGTVYLVIDDMKMKGNEAGWRVIPVGGNGTFAENDNTWEVVQVSAGQMRDVGASRGIGGLLLGLDVVVMFI